MRLQNHIFAFSLCITIVLGYLIMALYFPKLYLLATYEDLAGEWLQFWLFAAGTLFFARLVLIPSRFRFFFGILALGCFYVSMEEISWGQRIFNLATPEFFEKHNLQKETNFHNLFAGPVATLTKDLITFSLSAGIALYGVVYPLALRRGWWITRPMMKLGIAPPPLFLWPFFACGAFLELGLFNFNETEVAEMIIATALSIMGLYYCRVIAHDRTLSSLGTSQADHCVPVAARVCILFALAIPLSIGATVHSYVSEHNQTKMENRINNGIEKFAARYKRYERWQAAVDLYSHIHHQQPHRSSILRKLAQCHRAMGDEEKFQLYTHRALSNDLARYQATSKSVALNQSLARTYRQLGQTAKAEHYLDAALRLGSAWVDDQPNSAKAAYWLGKTYKLLGQHRLAIEQFERAHYLDPLSSKYRKVYYGAVNADRAVSHPQAALAQE